MPPLPDWARAWGPPLFPATIRWVPEDFVVDERLSIEFSGEGEHDWLRVVKTGANTVWVAEQLGKYARVPLRDVGYSGLKDRHAVTTQWFSVRRQVKQPTDWSRFAAEDVRILEHHVHSRKLKRGAHRGNGFRIRVRSSDAATYREPLTERLAKIASQGIPNYFGEQRFGRDGGNVELGRAVLGGRRLSRAKRSIGISALRSFEFNQALDARVRDDSWNQLLPGDVASLEGSGSVFDVNALTPELEIRCAELDIHPTAALPSLEQLRVGESRRALRLRVQDLSWDVDGDALSLRFVLGRGGYATAMLRELVCSAVATTNRIDASGSD